MKSNQHVEPVIADDFSSVTFRVQGHDDIVLHMDKLHPDIIRRAACVGMAQVRIVDAAAIPAADKAGNIIPMAERVAAKHAKMAALVEWYETGTDQWSRVTEGGPDGGLLFLALCRLYPTQTAEQVRAFLDARTDKEQAALREDDQVAPIIAAIKAERKAKVPAAERPDTKSLLAGLTAPAAPAPAPAP